METQFPENEGYDGLFLVSVRKHPNNTATIQRTGTAILKRTYDIDPTKGTLTPAAETLPVFVKDQPDNQVLNSDFESAAPDADDNPIPIAWEPTDATILQVEDPSNDENHLLQVTGAANGRVVQTLGFEEPLGGRQFVFSFSAKADATAQIQGVHLEANGDDGLVALCAIDANLDETMRPFEGSEIWPASLRATEMRVVLRMATDATHTVFYDNVQVEERGYRTVWDPITTLRYEHDLAAFKPEGDVIVLGFSDFVGRNAVKVNGNLWSSREIGSNTPPEKALFGWEPRVDDTRKEEAAFPEENDAYPLGDPLPVGFNNRFYNGYRRDCVTPDDVPLPYLPAAAWIEIERGGTIGYRFALRGDTVATTYCTYKGIGADEERNWQSRPVTMNLDTLVIEPEKNRCYVVWRGVWPFDRHKEFAYRRLVVKAST